MNNVRETLQIYTRKECCLCHDMLENLKAWQQQFNFEIKLIDIDTDPELTERFAARIPLLAAGEREICQYHFDEEALLSFFNTLN